MREYSFTTPHGIAVTRTLSKAAYRAGLRHLLRDLDLHRGIYLSSGYEYPGRYSRWDIASTRPPLEIVSYDRKVEFRPLSIRGEILNRILLPVLEGHPHWETSSPIPAAAASRACGRSDHRSPCAPTARSTRTAARTPYARASRVMRGSSQTRSPRVRPRAPKRATGSA